MAISYGNTSKVKESIRGFLDKLKACDAIPEELAEDALEMAEEVRDALCEEVEDEEADILEITKDEGMEKLEAKLEDTIARVLRNSGVIVDKSFSALDELEEELRAKVDDEELEEEVKETKDSIQVKKFIRDMKPLISSVKNLSTRKRLADSLAKMARMNLNTTNDYSSILEAVNKNVSKANDAKANTVDNDMDFGMSVAMKHNPHYKGGN